MWYDDSNENINRSFKLVSHVSNLIDRQQKILHASLQDICNDYFFKTMILTQYGFLLKMFSNKANKAVISSSETVNKRFVCSWSNKLLQKQKLF